jgi:hypothetical protein
MRVFWFIFVALLVSAPPVFADEASGGEAAGETTPTPSADARAKGTAGKTTKTPSSSTQKGGVGTLHIVTEKTGVEVILDGKLIGKTPLPGPWAVAVGPHRLELRGDGLPMVRELTIEARRATSVKYTEGAASSTSGGSGKSSVFLAAPPISYRSAGLATAGAGVTLLTLGFAYGLQAQATAERATNLDRSVHERARFDGLVERTQTTASMSNAMIGVGVVAVLAGAALNLFTEDGPYAGLLTVGSPESFAESAPRVQR